MSNGDTRPLERCDCVEQNDVTCGGADTNRFLSGYSRWGGDRSLMYNSHSSLPTTVAKALTFVQIAQSSKTV